MTETTPAVTAPVDETPEPSLETEWFDQASSSQDDEKAVFYGDPFDLPAEDSIDASSEAFVAETASTTRETPVEENTPRAVLRVETRRPELSQAGSAPVGPPVIVTGQAPVSTTAAAPARRGAFKIAS